MIRSDWHHDKNMFVIACRYAKRSISEADYQALLLASDWQLRALLSDRATTLDRSFTCQTTRTEESLQSAIYPLTFSS